MTQATLDIDWLVREVLRELGLPAAGGSPAPALPPAAPPPPTVAPPPAPSPQPVAAPAKAAAQSGQLAINAPVVTLATLAGRLDGVRKVVVSRGAVVTPAVYDELYRRNVTLAFASAEAAPKTGGLRLLLVTAGKRFDPAQLVAALRAMSLDVESTSIDCLMAASDRLAAAVAAGNTLGVLITRHTAAALCIANRLAGVRAVAVGDAGKLIAAAESVGANVLVLDPQCGLFAMKRMVGDFCRDGVRECPEVFRKRLQ